MKKLTLHTTLYLAVIIFCSNSLYLHGQALTLNSLHQFSENKSILIKEGTSLEKGLTLIEKTFSIRFLYRGQVVRGKQADHTFKLSTNFDTAVSSLEKRYGIHIKKINEKTYGVYPKPADKSRNANTVSGTVYDYQTETTLPGVNITVKGASNGTSTDANGRYSLQVPSLQDTLMFSFVGYKRKRVPIKGRSVINIKMRVKTLSGKELVVVGYGTQQEKDVNGSISRVSAEDIENIPEFNVGQLLQGQAAGVTVTHNSGAPGGASSVHIRGITSIGGNNQPLYVIDGVPVSGDANNQSTSGRSVLNGVPGLSDQGSSTVSPLSQLNPNDIKSISILKDASAEAIYGARGANGVVIIETKNGQSGEGSISYSGSVGIQGPVRKLDVMNLRQYARLQNKLADVYPGATQQYQYSRPSILGEGTNWQDALYQHGAMQNHQLAFSGGNDDFTYYVSGGYSDKSGIVRASEYKRYTIKSNVDMQVTDWFKAGIKINGSFSKDNLALVNAYNGAINLGLLTRPSQAVYNADGSFAGPSEDQNIATAGQANPIGRLLNTTNTTQRNKFLGNLYTRINITKDLRFKSSFSGNYNANKTNRFNPTYQYGTVVNNQATAYNARQNYNYWDWRNYFTYSHTFAGEHDITLLLGQEAQKSTWEGISANGSGFQNNNIHTLNQAQPTSIDGFKGEYTLESYYTRLNYTFEQKYGLTATFRADGSSKFAKGHKYGYFPSIAGHWDVDEEPFMDELDHMLSLSNLTLKAGYGVTGQQGIGNYLYTSTLNTFNTGLGSAYSVNNISNPDLTWENQRQLNLGINLGFFENRLSATVEVYNKISKNFLFTLPLPLFLTGNPGYRGGINAPTVNLGKLRNRGIDVTLQYQTKSSKDFSWDSKLTLSHYKNKVLSLNNRLNITGSVYNGYTSTIITNTVKGGPVGRFYGYKVKGLFRDSTTIEQQPKQFGKEFAQPSVSSDSLWLGDVQYVDINDDGVVNAEDKTYIGNPNPDFTFGFTNKFNYKNVNLSIFLQGSIGNEIYNYLRKQTTSLNSLYTNQLAVASDFYTSNNKDAKYPRPRQGQANQNLLVSSRFVEDGSYLRIKNVQLGYTIPQRLTQQLSVNRLHIYGSIQNLYTFTNYSGYGPDIGSKNQNDLLSGIDNGRYPDARIFTVGVNIKF